MSITKENIYEISPLSPDQYKCSNSFRTSHQLVSNLSYCPTKMLKNFSLQKLRINWTDKTPKQKVEFIYKIPNYALLAVGSRTLTDDNRYWYSYTGYITITIYFSIAVYTIMYHSLHNKSLKFLNSICSGGMAVSVCIKTDIFQKKRKFARIGLPM